ncbi:UNVERIFIED_CONTAM: hypothetical protein LK11_22750 [Mumia flava]
MRLRVRLQVVLTTLLLVTNLVGVVIVAALRTLITPGGGPNAALGDALRIAVPLYVALAVVVGGAVTTAGALRALRWVRAGREPTASESRVALLLPWRLTLVQAVLWVGGVVVFTALASSLQPEATTTTFFAVGIAGVVVCAVAFLLTEFALRPVAALVLDRPGGFERVGAGVGVRMLVFWCLGTAAPLLGIAVVATLSLTGSDISLRRLALIVLTLSAVVLVFGFLVNVLTARSVVRPLTSVRHAVSRVGDGDLDVHVRVDDGTELGLLQAGINDMAAGLREREAIRDLFGRHVGREVADVAARGQVELGGEARVVSVLMIDVVGSTAYASSHSPVAVVDVLNRFFAAVVEEVDRHGGLVNKFMGDAVLAIFGAPQPLPNHAAAALATARAVRARLTVEVPEVGSGIGVATGEAVAGNVGHRSRFEYTVIGDVVNSAARLSDLAKTTDAGIVATARSVAESGADERRHWRDDGAPVLRGRSEPTAVCAPADVP